MSNPEYVQNAEYTLCKNCQRCGAAFDKFCSACGSEMSVVAYISYVGENPTKGIYRISIVIEREFRNLDHAKEAAEKSCLGDDNGYFRDFSGPNGKSPITINFIGSTVTKHTHPYVCRSCRESENRYLREHATVSSTNNGRCEYCAKIDWVLR